MAKPPCRNFLLNKKLTMALFGTFLLWFFFIPFGITSAYGKDQHQISRLTNNKTFYATEIPFLSPAPTLLAMRHVPTHEPISMAFDLVNAKKLAEIAKKDAPFKYSHRRCLAWVRKGLSKLLGLNKTRPLDLNSLPNDPIKAGTKKKTFPNKGLSAENFKNWVLNNPNSLCQNLKLANVKEYPDLAPQEGVLYLYGKGRCGFNKRHGHIEVLTDAVKGEACSDHCRIISQPCEPDVILAPVAHCDWIAKDDKKEQRPMLKSVSDPKPLLMSKYIERPSLAK